MTRKELLFQLSQKAAKRMLIATELVSQLSAVQTFENQQIVGSDVVRDDVIRIVKGFHEEVNEVTRLIDEFLELRAMEDGAEDIQT